MKVFAVVAVLLVAYARGDVTELTQAEVQALSLEESKAITDEQWGILYSRWCNPAFQSYAKSQYLPDRMNCHYFYECVGFRPVRMECAANLYWNAEVETCDYPYRAGCWYNPGGPIHVQPVHPVQPVQPVHPVQPIQPVKPVQPVQPHYPNNAIEIPINNDPLIIDPYKQ